MSKQARPFSPGAHNLTWKDTVKIKTVDSALRKKEKRGVGAHEVLLFYVRLSRKASRSRCPFSEEKPADSEGGSFRPAGDGPGGTGRAKALRCKKWGRSHNREAKVAGAGSQERAGSRAPHSGPRSHGEDRGQSVLAHLRACGRPRPTREPQESQKTKEEAEPSLHAPCPLLPPPHRPPRQRRLPLSSQFKSQPLSTPEKRVPRAAEPWGTTSSATLPSWASRSASSPASTT